MNAASPITAMAIGAWSMASCGLACAQSSPYESLARRIVQIDIAMLACSTRLEVDGFRYNRVQSEWRNILIAEGAAAEQLYKRIYDAEMIEVLRVMANDEKRGCTYAFSRVTEIFNDDSPLKSLEPLH